MPDPRSCSTAALAGCTSSGPPRATLRRGRARCARVTTGSRRNAPITKTDLKMGGSGQNAKHGPGLRFTGSRRSTRQRRVERLDPGGFDARDYNSENVVSIPWDGPFYESRSYPTRRKGCLQKIFVVRCTYGSTVLFDHLGLPSPKHVCAGWRSNEWSGAGRVRGGRTVIASDAVTE